MIALLKKKFFEIFNFEKRPENEYAKMVENVQCPVCTLFLHAEINLADHLETHPKKQVIKALVQLTVAGNISSITSGVLKSATAAAAAAAAASVNTKTEEQHSDCEASYKSENDMSRCNRRLSTISNTSSTLCSTSTDSVIFTTSFSTSPSSSSAKNTKNIELKIPQNFSSNDARCKTSIPTTTEPTGTPQTVGNNGAGDQAPLLADETTSSPLDSATSVSPQQQQATAAAATQQKQHAAYEGHRPVPVLAATQSATGATVPPLATQFSATSPPVSGVAQQQQQQQQQQQFSSNNGFQTTASVIPSEIFTTSNTSSMSTYIGNSNNSIDNNKSNVAMQQKKKPNKDYDQRRQFWDNRKLFLGRIPHHASKKELKTLFARFGTVWELRIVSTPTAKLPPGVRNPWSYGFITYDDPKSVQNCLSACPLYFPENSEDGQKLIVELKKPRSRSDLTPRQTMGSGNKKSGGDVMGGGGQRNMSGGPKSRSLSNSGNGSSNSGMLRGNSAGGNNMDRGGSGSNKRLSGGGFNRNCNRTGSQSNGSQMRGGNNNNNSAQSSANN